MAGVFDITKFDWGTAFNVAFLATLAALGKGLLAREHSAPTSVAVEISPSTLPSHTYEQAVRRS
ncbi:hypothetical protein DMA12_40215 [Amycolatopsis balhimycina DSM 5908]|uniref:Uncharacterized protein n=1 Tax=Amycolatopsis balhimycina DSM 5908 TaxID=1081091 RepID=A0A428W070_AMYBA|nr:hypothetical protein [Amycolatopsis balhimycina]RSM36456.1 hypothetical protein DMA12_40215 [Amycolatopsis balhimycina DSM 5908]